MDWRIRSTDAVSSVIGTVLMLGITVTVFAGLSVVILGEYSEANDQTRTDLSARTSGSVFLLQHQGGDALETAGGSIIVTYDDGFRETYSLADKWAAYTSSDLADWEIGETICISCELQAEIGIHGAMRDVLVVYGNTVLLSETGIGVMAGGPGGGGGGATGGTGPNDDFDGDGIANSLDTDDDGDGIADTSDFCQFSVNGVLASPIWLSATGPDATSDGCKDGAEAADDTDKDGVPDLQPDNCPNTPIGIAVDEDGCAGNGENNGVCDLGALAAKFVLANNEFSVNTNAGASTDADCSLRFEWDWTNDGTYDDGPVATPIGFHSYPSGGTYVIKLRVTVDGEAGASTITKSVTVGPGSSSGGACINYNAANGECGSEGDVAIDVTGPVQNCFGQANCDTSETIGFIVTDPAHGLVIPAGHAPINPGNKNVIFAAPQDVIFASDVQINGGGNDVTIRSTSGDIHVEGAEISASNGNIRLDAPQGSIFAASPSDSDLTTFVAKDDILMSAGESSMTTGGIIDVQNGIFEAGGETILTASNNNGATEDILLSKARFGSDAITFTVPNNADGIIRAWPGTSADGVVLCKNNQWDLPQVLCKSNKTTTADAPNNATIIGLPKQGTIA